MLIKKTEYNQLIKYISSQYESARLEMVRSYWNIGKRIVEIEQKGDQRADYGSSLIARLSADLTDKYGKGFSKRNLENMRRFFLAYPKTQTSAFLSWSKYSELSQIQDNTKRESITQKAEIERLSVREIKELVKRENKTENPVAGEQKRPAKLRVIKRSIRVFRQRDDAATPTGCIRIDCGFHVYRIIPEDSTGKIRIGSISYTYPARINSIVDGDTIRADIELGFETEVMQILRLRHINSPELKTPAGKRSRKFLQSTLKDVKKIVVRTYSRDLYGRYLADVFFLPGSDDPEEILAKGKYLSQVMLDAGHAEKY